MSQSSEDTNAATESKCQSNFSLENIIFLAKLAERCLPIRKTLFYFFFHVYLETEKELRADVNQIKLILLMCNADLIYITDKIEKIQNGEIRIKNYKGYTSLI